MIKKIILANSSLMIVGLLLNFVFRIYLANHFEKEDLIVYYTLLDTVTLFTMIFVGFKDTLNKLFFHSKDKLKELYTYNSLVGLLILLSQLVIIPLVYYGYLSEKLNVDISFFTLSLMFLSLSIAIYLINILLVNRVYKIVTAFDFMKVILFLMVFFILYKLFKFEYGYSYLIYTFIITNTLLIVMLLYYIPDTISQTFRLNFRAKDLKIFLKNGMVSSAEYFISTLILYFALMFFISYFSVDEVALFQVVAKPIYLALISIFSFPIFRFLLPEFSKLISENNIDKIRAIRSKFIKYNIIFGLLLVAGGYLFMQSIISYMFPAEYSESFNYINVLVISIPFIVYNSFAFAIIKGHGLFFNTLTVRAVGLLTFVLSFYLLYYFNYGAFSIIYALLVGTIFMSMVSYYFEQKLLKGTL